MGSQSDRRTIVVGVDGSPQSLRAVRWGAAEAVRRCAVLRLVTAFNWLPAPTAGHPGLRENYRELLLERSEIHLLAAVREAERQAPAIEVDHQVLVGSPYAVLGSESPNAELVVVGDRGHGRLEGLLVGSVAVGLAAGAGCPVVVVRGAERDPAEAACLPVVVGVDGAPENEPAIGFDFDAAASRGVPLVAVHTWWSLVVDPALAPLLDWEAIEADEGDLLEQQLTGWAEKFPDVPVERVVTRGHPARTLMARAARAQLVVVGSRGRRELAGLVLGSVSNALIHRADCPVAIVRPTAGGGGPDAP